MYKNSSNSKKIHIKLFSIPGLSHVEFDSSIVLKGPGCTRTNIVYIVAGVHWCQYYDWK